MTIVNDADERREKKKKRRREEEEEEEEKKQFWASAVDKIFFIIEISEISLCHLSSLSFCDRIGAEPKKSSQSKRTFHSLRQNTNCIGHTLRRVWGRKRRKRERNARVFLSSSQRERERVFLSRHPSSLKEEI